MSPASLPPFNPAPTTRQSEPPNPGWKYGEGYEGSVGADKWAKEAEAGYKSIDTSNATQQYVASRYYCNMSNEFTSISFFEGIIPSHD